MANIKQYTKKNGSKAYMFKAYVGTNEVTGKKQYTTRRGFTTQKQAKLALSRLLLEVEHDGFKIAPASTYKDIYDLWIVEYDNTVEPSTFVKTNSYFKHHILPAFGNLKINKITVEYCQQTVNIWFKQLNKYQFVMNYASMVFKYAVKHGIIDRNPIDLISYPRKKKTIESDKWENFYDRDELKAFIKALDNEEQTTGHYEAVALFKVLAFTGIREGECFALTWNDIDFSQRMLTINKSVAIGKNNQRYVKATKTKNSNRIIDIDNYTIRVLKQWQIRQRQELFMLGFNVNENSSNQLVFSNTRNQFLRQSTARQWLTNIIKKYSLKFIRIHGFRHTHASLLFESNASIKEVQVRLGHKDIKTTMDIYTHVSKYEKRDTVNKLMKYLDL